MVCPRRAIVLAAGSGSRLWPYTKDLPKTLLNVGNFTIFDRIAICLHEVGIEEIVVVSGHTSSRLESHIANNTNKLINNPQLQFKIIKNDHLELGNIYSLWLAKHEMKQDFLLLDSDVVFHRGILDLLTSDQHNSAIVFDGTKKTLGKDQSKVIISDAQMVKDIGKTIHPLGADGEYVGIMKISASVAKHVLHVIHGLLAAPLFPQYYTHPFRLVAKESDCFFACSTEGLPWIEIDTIEDLNYATSMVIPLLEKRSKIIELNNLS